MRRLGEHERGVVFRLGRLDPRPRGPGWVWTLPVLDGLVVVPVDERERQVAVDGVRTSAGDARVSATVRFRVVDPVAAVVHAEDAEEATLAAVALALRSAAERRRSVDDPAVADEARTAAADAAAAWGVEVRSVRIGRTARIEETEVQGGAP